MGWRCRGCGVLRCDPKIRTQGVVLRCTPTRRLCKLFDTRLIDHCPHLTIGEYEDLDRLVLVDYVAAISASAQLAIPTTAGAFEELIKGLHRQIFRRAVPSIAGVFREEAVFFGPNQRFEGCPWRTISVELQRLFRRCSLDQTDFATLSRRSFVRKIAVFLEAFFMVHPFRDGNGRVARTFTAMLCHHSRRWAFATARNDGNHRTRRKYDRVLTWAHDGLPQGELPAARPRQNPYYLLDEWIDGRLTDVLADSELIEEPPLQPHRASVPPAPELGFIEIGDED